MKSGPEYLKQLLDKSFDGTGLIVDVRYGINRIKVVITNSKGEYVSGNWLPHFGESPEKGVDRVHRTLSYNLDYEYSGKYITTQDMAKKFHDAAQRLAKKHN